MVAKVRTVAFQGVEVIEVETQVTIASGLPVFTVVGLPDKAVAGFRKTRHRGLARVGWMFTLTATAYNLVRLPKLVGAAA